MIDVHDPSALSSEARVPTTGTLTQLFFDTIEKFGDHPAALRYKAGGTWRGITHAELL